jgi:hypothetical protein
MPFDARRAIQHHVHATISGMKSFLFAAFLACTAAVSAFADIPLPKPSQLVVSNLSAFPKVKFTIASGDIRTQPLTENKTYELKSNAQLYVEDADHKPRVWATVEHHEFTGQSVKIRVKEVRYGKKDIEVLHDVEKAPLPVTPRKRPIPATAEVMSPFLLGLAGCSGLIFLARRRRSQDKAA